MEPRTEERHHTRLQRDLFLIECSHSLLDSAIESRKIPARRGVVHRSKGLRIEPVGVQKIK